MASALAASLASGQTAGQDNFSAIKLEQDPPATLNRFGLSYRVGLNISARFKDVGGYPMFSNPHLTPNGALWNYDNGYVYEDIQGNNSPMTWYWGYSGLPSSTGLPRRDAQVSADGHYLYLSTFSGASDVDSGARQGDPQQPGLELTYNRELGRSGKTSWGLEGAVNYLNFALHDNRTLYGNVTRQTDAYAFPPDPNIPGGFVTPPDPPRYGTFVGPGPVMEQTPTPGAGSTTVLPGDAIISGQRKLDANIYGFRVGPYVEYSFSPKVSLGLSGGLALAWVKSQFSFNETVTIPGVGSVNHAGSSSGSDFLVGGYAAGTFSYAFSKTWSALAGVQYQILDRTSVQAAGKIAELDLRNALFVTIGLGYSF